MLWLLVLLTHAQKGVKLQYVEPVSMLIVWLILNNVHVEATVKILDVCNSGLIVPIRKLYDLK